MDNNGLTVNELIKILSNYHGDILICTSVKGIATRLTSEMLYIGDVQEGEKDDICEFLLIKAG